MRCIHTVFSRPIQANEGTQKTFEWEKERMQDTQKKKKKSQKHTVIRDGMVRGA